MLDIGDVEIIIGDKYIAILDDAGNVYLSNEADRGEIKDSYHLVEHLLDAAEQGDVVGLLDGGSAAVGIRRDGTLIFYPEDWDETIKAMLECSCVGVAVTMLEENLEEMASWKNVCSAYGCFPNDVIGILEDGTIVSAGLYQIAWDEAELAQAQSWTQLTDVAMVYSGYDVVALRKDGEVYQIHVPQAEKWHHIAMLAEGYAIYALTEDGDVLCSDGTEQKQMKNIVYLAAGAIEDENGHIVDLVLGIRRDGKVIDQNGNEWKEFYGCVALDISEFGVIAGVKKDGSVVVGGAADEGMYRWAETVHVSGSKTDY